jgi:membrane protein implicated in regulation of membrane protease activity
MAEGLFADWIWLLFVATGLVLIILELIIGVSTGLDLVFIGSAFIIGGLVALPFHSWMLALIVTSIICIAYIILGRRFVHRWTLTRESKTNIDAIIGRKGTVISPIKHNNYGLVKIGNEQWRARATDDIEEDEEIIVINIIGVTLTVEKTEGGK